MKLGFLYAGQGSQKVGMGLDFYENHPSFAKVFDAVSLDFDVKETTFYDSENKLNLTQYTQPCMVTYAVAVTDLLRENGITPASTLGLSLGEYSALYGAGVMDAMTAISLVAYRGKAMDEAVIGMESGMTAVVGLDRASLLSACEAASDVGVVEISNYNCPDQMVIGGEQNAVTKAAAIAKEYGARRCLPLKVSGPFHTSLLKSAGDKMRIKLENTELFEPKVPIFYNCLGAENVDNIPVAELLERQVQSSVYLEDCIRSMGDSGVDAMVEIGAAPVLTAFVRKILPDMKVYPLSSCADFDALLEVANGTN